MGKKMQGQIIQWPKEKYRDRQYNGQKNIQGQTIQWSKKYIGTDNTLAKNIYRDRQYNGQKKKEEDKQ